MADEKVKEPRPTGGEELGGLLGCLALVLAIALFLWLAFAGCHGPGTRSG